MPSHRYDIAEMNDLVVSKSVLYELSQSTLSLIGDLHTIEIVDQKSSDKTATRYALSLLVPRYKIFSSSADAFKKWFDECNKKMEDRKNSLR